MNSSRSVGRSIWAVVAGIIVVLVLTLITDLVLHVMGVFPRVGQPLKDGPLVLATAYRIVFAIVGSYVAARLALDRPIWHAVMVGVVGFLASVAGAAITWNKGRRLGRIGSAGDFGRCSCEGEGSGSRLRANAQSCDETA
jgi:hypothetical protein